MVISWGIIRVAPFRALISLLITYLLSPLPLQVMPEIPEPGNPEGVFRLLEASWVAKSSVFLRFLPLLGSRYHLGSQGLMEAGKVHYLGRDAV